MQIKQAQKLAACKKLTDALLANAGTFLMTLLTKNISRSENQTIVKAEESTLKTLLTKVTE